MSELRKFLMELKEKIRCNKIDIKLLKEKLDKREQDLIELEKELVLLNEAVEKLEQ